MNAKKPILFKHELAERIAPALEMSPTAAGRVITALVDALRGSLKAGEVIEIRGLGKFSVRSRKARPGRHPITGAPIMLAAKQYVHYRPADDLNRSVQPTEAERRAEKIKAGIGTARPRFPDVSDQLDMLGGAGL